jgi:predicted  nucleic acid-binding Zn-ribbon protein
MFKNIISPVQAWLLSQGRCVGCGVPLKNGVRRKGKETLERVTCKCGRIYMYDTKTRKYRRAKIEEI